MCLLDLTVIQVGCHPDLTVNRRVAAGNPSDKLCLTALTYTEVPVCHTAIIQSVMMDIK